MPSLFLTNFFFPKPMANGVCIYQVAKAACKEDGISYVLCYRREGEKEHEIIDGIDVRRINLPKYHQWSFAETTTTIGKVTKQAGLLAGRLKKAIHVFDYPLRDGAVVRRFVKEACELIDAEKVVRIVCSYTPAEAVKAGQIIKRIRPNIKYIYYSLDTLSNESGAGFLPEKYRRSLGVQREITYFDSADRIILMNCHKAHYNSAVYEKFKNKISYADFPLFCPVYKNECITAKLEKHIVYAGSLYRTIRNPKAILDILSRVLNENYIDFYGYSDCDDIIMHYSEQTKGHVRIHGLLPYDEVQSKLSEADVLLSIGNKGTQMAPSKIYEYISTGKSIIHYYSSKQDACLNALSKYPNAFLVEEGTEPNYDELRKFIDNSHIVELEKLNNSFYQSNPYYTLSLIISDAGDKNAR